MSSIILSALWGVVMMFSGIFMKKKSLAKYIALLGMLALLTVNFLEYYNVWHIYADIGQMLKFTSFSHIFNAIVLACTFLFFILNAAEL
jgi:NADH-quinone oxidoreductase subunit N